MKVLSKEKLAKTAVLLVPGTDADPYDPNRGALYRYIGWFLMHKTPKMIEVAAGCYQELLQKWKMSNSRNVVPSFSHPFYEGAIDFSLQFFRIFFHCLTYGDHWRKPHKNPHHDSPIPSHGVPAVLFRRQATRSVDVSDLQDQVRCDWTQNLALIHINIYIYILYYIIYYILYYIILYIVYIYNIIYIYTSNKHQYSSHIYT